jgi:CheY-like chemotaxis protein
MPAAQSVLIVDRFSETREVLRTVLERRGVRIYEAADATEGWRLARLRRPDLIVMDVEENATTEAAVLPPDADGNLGSVPVVLLGSARRPKKTKSDQVYVTKPFQYVDLIRQIEGILAGFTAEQAPRGANGR